MEEMGGQHNTTTPNRHKLDHRGEKELPVELWGYDDVLTQNRFHPPAGSTPLTYITGSNQESTIHISKSE